MDARDLLLMQHAAVHGLAVRGRGRPTLADRAFGKASDEQMRRRPTPALNSLAWLLWHMARAEDVFVNVILSAQSQVLAGGWASRMRVTQPDIGTGMTAGEVAALSEEIDLAALRDYRDTVGRRTREVVAAMPAEAWDGRVGADDIQRAVDAGAFGPNAGSLGSFFTGWPRAALLSSIAVLHSAQHIGEAVTVRGAGGFGLAE
jgi:hypothetical protein